MVAIQRAAWIVVLSVVAGCESTGGIGSVLGGIVEGTMQGVGGVVGDKATAAGSAAMGSATDMLCGKAGSATCRNMTNTMLSGFSEEFVARMSQRDLAMIAEARDRSLESGKVETWKNEESGATGTVDSKPAQPLPPTPTQVKVEKGSVQALPAMTAVGEEYQVTASGGANMRSGPGTGYAVVGKLGGGETLTAIAKVQDQDWYLMGRQSVASGYVFGALVKPAPNRSAAQPAQPPAQPEVEEVTANIGAECYTTTQTVTLGDGTSEEATITSCRTPDGWAQV